MVVAADMDKLGNSAANACAQLDFELQSCGHVL